MDKQELRELDAWIAEQGKLWALVYATGVRFKFSSDPSSFALVKHEIERRGWKWYCEYHPRNRYWFLIWEESETDDLTQMLVTVLGEGYHRTEELAGCLAFKAAIETVMANGSQD